MTSFHVPFYVHMTKDINIEQSVPKVIKLKRYTFDLMFWEALALGRPESNPGIGYSIPKSGIGIEFESHRFRFPRKRAFLRENALIWRQKSVFFSEFNQKFALSA